MDLSQVAKVLVMSNSFNCRNSTVVFARKKDEGSNEAENNEFIRLMCGLAPWCSVPTVLNLVFLKILFVSCPE